jgi:hypothetical protein
MSMFVMTPVRLLSQFMCFEWLPDLCVLQTSRLVFLRNPGGDKNSALAWHTSSVVSQSISALSPGSLSPDNFVILSAPFNHAMSDNGLLGLLFPSSPFSFN